MSLGCVTGVFPCGQAVQGTGLAFIVYSEAIKNMEVSQLWSVLYFFMLLMLGMGSMLGNTAAILTPLTDSKVISSRLPKEAISGEWPARGGGPGCRGEQVDELPQRPHAGWGGTGGCAPSWWSCHGFLLVLGRQDLVHVIHSMNLVLHIMGK